jgi:tRNA pseudouridine55 synthase
LTGFLLVDKPPGPTSHDVVDAVRRALGVRRVGHAGTLDPPASGLIVVGVGPATRLLSYVQRLPKTYEAMGVLGVRTTTLDAVGDVVSTHMVDVTEGDVRMTLDTFRGRIEQVPPAVSAIKVRGERAYRRVARGEAVEMAPRRVEVHAIELTSFEPPSFGVRVRCSAGTYVRSLIADAGDRLGCGAHVHALRRTAIGSLLVEDAVSIDALSPADVQPVERILYDMPRALADAETERRARSGQRVRLPTGDGEVLLIGPGGPVGVFEARDGILRPVTVLGS